MNGMALAWRLARRELRAGVRGFRVFIACLALGVAAIAGIGSLSQSVVAGLRADARTLLGGDVALRLHNRTPTAAEEAFVEAHAAALSASVTMRAMARPADASAGRLLVELKAVDERYPLVGAMVLEPPMALASALARKARGDWGAVVDAGLLARLGLGLGGRVRVGEATFEVRATIAREPDRVASVFALGPRFMIGSGALAATGLVQPGSQMHYHRRVLVPPGTDAGAWIRRLEAALPEAGWRVRGTDEAAPGVRRFVERLSQFLTFAGLTALLVGGIGVGNAVGSYLDGKTATIATLKSLGAPAGLIFRIYLLHVGVLAAAGIALGLALGAGVPALGAAALAGLLPAPPRVGLYAGPLAIAAAFGALTAVTFALWPLARARGVPAASLFRARLAPVRARPRAQDAAAIGVGVAALAGLTVATAGEAAFAYWFVGGSAAAIAVLYAGGRGLAAGSRRLSQGRNPVWRLALGNIHRPGSTAPSVVLSLGLGLAVLVAIALIQGNLERQIDERLPETAPAFFFIDIQPHQVEAFDAVVAAVPGSGAWRRVPTLRGRIVRIAGRPVEEAEIAPGARWAVHGDRVLTYAATKGTETRIVAGRWWPADYRGPPLISLDAGVARGFGVGVGDSLTLNVLGRRIEATIASLRDIDWRSLRFDFAIVFAPGTLEGAPQTHIAAVEAEPGAEAALETAVTDRFANVSAIRVREALAAAARMLAGIGAAVRATAAIAILAGAMVLAGAVAAGQRRRVYDAVVLKVLGATRGWSLAVFVTEFAILGLATGAIASLVGSLTAWAVVVHLMGLGWVFLPGVVAATVLGSVAVTVVVGFAGTWRALGQKAAPHLRNE